MRRMVVRLACVMLLLVPTLASAQDSKSAAVAGELVKMLDQLKLDSVAAAQPGNQSCPT